MNTSRSNDEIGFIIFFQILHLNINLFHKKMNGFMKLIHPNISAKANGNFSLCCVLSITKTFWNVMGSS